MTTQNNAGRHGNPGRPRPGGHTPDSPASKTAAAPAASGDASQNESPEERARREAIDARERQVRALERAANEISSRFGMPGEDEEELQNQRGAIRRTITDLNREIEDLRASQSMNFPSPEQIATLGRAMDELEARIATNAAATAIAEAAGDVMDAFGM